MKKNYIKSALVLCTIIFSIVTLRAQVTINTGNAFMQGQFMEVGVSGCGTYGTQTTATVPVGFHPRVETGNTNGIGIISDAGSNGFAVAGPGALPNYCGDYSLPGTPVEGWGVQFNGTSYINTDRCGATAIPGTITASSGAANPRSATWTGAVAGLGVSQTTVLTNTDLYFVTCVTLTNNTTATMNNLYYVRNIDPDNDRNPGGNYVTTNTVVSQPSGTTDALVTAVGGVYGCYLGLGSNNSNALVSRGSFSTSGPLSNYWTGVGHNTTVGSTSTADEAISIAFYWASLAPGQSVNLSFVYITSAAVNNTALAAGCGGPCSSITDTVYCNGSDAMMDINITNNSSFNFDAYRLHMLPSNAIVSSSNSINLAPGATGGPYSVNLTSLGLTPGSTVCFYVQSYGYGNSLCPEDTCTSDTFCIVVPDCKTDCCGDWVRTFYQGYDGHGLPISVPFTCGETIRYNCPPLTNLYSFEYACRGECKPTYNATLVDGAGVTVWTGTFTGSIYNVSLPALANGVYTLSVEVYCGDKLCGSCRIRIAVECVDCCGDWVRTYYQGYDGHGLPISIPFRCGETIRYNCPPLSNVYSFEYACRGECRPTYQATLTDETGATIWTGTYTGSVYDVSGLPISVNGTYTLSVDVYCGDRLCGSCRINIRVDCDFIDCCGEWGTIAMSDYTDPRAPIMRTIRCGGTYKTDCINRYDFFFSYFCREGCTPTYIIFLDAPDGSTTSTTYTGTPYTYTPTLSLFGTYRMRVNVYCGGRLCEECVIYLDNDCHIIDAKRANPNTTQSRATDVLEVFPNPASELISISTLVDNITSIEVIDANGKIVYSQKQNGSSRTATINISNLATGSYIIKINNNLKKNINISR